MILGVTPNIAAAQTPQFSDMPVDWSKAAIENSISNGLLTGANGKIMPDANLTRAQLATILNRAFGSSQKASLASFSDVKTGSWYYDEMAKAVSMGTFKGSDGKLSPGSFVTRQEVFTVLDRAFRLPSADLSSLNRFSDAASVSSWAESSVAALAAAGYINGTNGRLNPAASVTRAEFAQVMDNMIKGYLTASGTYSSVSDGNVVISAADVTLKDVTIKGDLIIGDGVGDGNVTLYSVKVTGRILVRGGGVNSIKITGTSEAGSVILARTDGKVRVVVSGDAKIQVIEVDDGSDDVFVEGTVGNISVIAEGITVTAGTASVAKSDFIIDAGISLFTKSEYDVSGYPLGEFGTGKSGIELIAYDGKTLDAPDVSLDYTNESIIGYNSSTMEYAWDDNYYGVVWSTDKDLSAANSLTEGIPSVNSSDLYIRVKSPQSASTDINIPCRPSAPSGLSASDTTTSSSSDGIITRLDSAKAYQYKLYTASTWTDAAASATEISGLAPGNYYVRLKATDKNFASRRISCNIFDASAPAPEVPSIINAKVTTDHPEKLILKFSKAMSVNGIDAKDFTVYGIGRDPESYFSINRRGVSTAINPDDPSIIVPAQPILTAINYAAITILMLLLREPRLAPSPVWQPVLTR